MFTPFWVNGVVILVSSAAGRQETRPLYLAVFGISPGLLILPRRIFLIRPLILILGSCSARQLRSLEEHGSECFSLLCGPFLVQWWHHPSPPCTQRFSLQRWSRAIERLLSWTSLEHRSSSALPAAERVFQQET
jgi:hypothetical protein